MIQQISYGDKLDKYVEAMNIIPYRLHRNSRYRTNCFYWIDYERSWFKVEEVEYNFDTTPPQLDHVTVSWMDGNRAWLCTDLTMYDFRLEKDKYKIADQKIINSDKSYVGGEIEYWLFRHHANFIQRKWRGFQKYFDPYSELCVDPNKFYFVKARKSGRGQYSYVELILDPTCEKFGKLTPKRDYIADESYTIKIGREEILKQRRRRQEIHESRNKKK